MAGGVFFLVAVVVVVVVDVTGKNFCRSTEWKRTKQLERQVGNVFLVICSWLCGERKHRKAVLEKKKKKKKKDCVGGVAQGERTAKKLGLDALWVNLHTQPKPPHIQLPFATPQIKSFADSPCEPELESQCEYDCGIASNKAKLL